MKVGIWIKIFEKDHDSMQMMCTEHDSLLYGKLSRTCCFPRIYLHKGVKCVLYDEEQIDEEILEDNGYEIRSLELLDDPIRKTEPLLYALQRYQITDDSRDEQFFGSRWVRLNLPQ